jgi:hypothetical protein
MLHTTKQCLFWEANNRTAIQEIPGILWMPSFITVSLRDEQWSLYRLSHINPVHAIEIYIYITFCIIIPPTRKYLKFSFHLVFSTKILRNTIGRALRRLKPTRQLSSHHQTVWECQQVGVKLHENVYFNKLCIARHFQPTYIDVNISNKSVAASLNKIQAQRKLIKNKLKFLHIKQDKQCTYYDLTLRCVRATIFAMQML